MPPLLRPSPIRMIVGGSFLPLVLLAGCGDDGESALERYCAAGESLASSVSALASLDLVAEGTDGLDAAITDVRDDLEDLHDAASEAAAGDVDALEEALDELDTALATLGGDLTSANASSVVDAIQAVGAAAQAILATLGDCQTINPEDPWTHLQRRYPPLGHSGRTERRRPPASRLGERTATACRSTPMPS